MGALEGREGFNLYLTAAVMKVRIYGLFGRGGQKAKGKTSNGESAPRGGTKSRRGEIKGYSIKITN